MENISKHISYKEATRSLTAIRLGLENKPNEYELSNMIGVAENIFEPLREWVNDPIKVNSFFRSIELNEAIGGSARSQHCQGRAIDIDDTYGHATNAEMFNWIKENLNFDQMIWEFGDDKNPDWVHISWVSEDQNRNRCLRAKRVNGKTTYTVI
jgi:zinc D-Ala-D-Ala carboxypeptidase